MSVRVPKYRFHKASGQALVEIKGQHIYLGKYDSPESHEQYRRLIARFLSQKPPLPEEAPRQSLRIDQLILQYFRFAKTYYVKNGKHTDEIVALAEVRDAAGHSNVSITSGYLHVAVEDDRVGSLFG